MGFINFPLLVEDVDLRPMLTIYMIYFFIKKKKTKHLQFKKKEQFQFSCMFKMSSFLKIFINFWKYPFDYWFCENLLSLILNVLYSFTFADHRKANVCISQGNAVSLTHYLTLCYALYSTGSWKQSTRSLHLDVDWSIRAYLKTKQN